MAQDTWIIARLEILSGDTLNERRHRGGICARCVVIAMSDIYGHRPSYFPVRLEHALHTAEITITQSDTATSFLAIPRLLLHLPD